MSDEDDVLGADGVEFPKKGPVGDGLEEVEEGEEDAEELKSDEDDEDSEEVE